MSLYSLQSTCRLRSLGSEYLLTVFPPGEAPYALKVNESFAFLFGAARKLGAFSEDDLVDVLLEEYDLSEEMAREEVSKIIALWKDHGLL